MIGMSDNDISKKYMEITIPIAEEAFDHKIEVWEAVTPKTLHLYNDITWGEKMPPLLRIEDGYRPFTETEKAVWHSHHNLWKKIYEQRSAAWIIEHDVDLTNFFMPDDQLMKKYDLITIPDTGCMWCYHINWKAAKRIFEKMTMRPMFLNTDGYIKGLMEEHFSFKQISTTVKMDVKCFMDYGSTIDHPGNPLHDQIAKDPSILHYAHP